jgi:serine protease AprX
LLDTGVAPVADLVAPKNRLLAFQDFIHHRPGPYDDNGHGTHVAGIAAGNGGKSGGRYAGVAPECNVVAIKILDGAGQGSAADVLAGLQWMLDHRAQYGVRVANLSVGTPDQGPRDPLVRAVERAWDEGVVMVVAAGNRGPGAGSVTSPGVSRKVVTVGASDDGQPRLPGKTQRHFSGRGPTSECIVKPDLVAPGAGIVSCRSPTLAREIYRRAQPVSEDYLRMSGTSMATPMISGAIALLLQRSPNLAPDEVKYRLKQCAVNLQHPRNQQGWGLLNVERLLE